MAYVNLALAVTGSQFFDQFLLVQVSELGQIVYIATSDHQRTMIALRDKKKTSEQVRHVD